MQIITPKIIKLHWLWNSCYIQMESLFLYNHFQNTNMHEIYWLPGCQPIAVYLLGYRNGSINKVNTLSIFNWGNFFLWLKYLISVWTLRPQGLYLIFLLSDSSQLSQYLTWKNCPYFQLPLLLWFWLSVQHLECVFWNWKNPVRIEVGRSKWKTYRRICRT